MNTDHKPLTYLVTPNARHCNKPGIWPFIAEFTTDIRYVKGETNFVADAQSRPSVTVLAREACGRVLHAQNSRKHDLEFTTTLSQNSPSYTKGVVAHPVTHTDIFLHTLSTQS